MQVELLFDKLRRGQPVSFVDAKADAQWLAELQKVSAQGERTLASVPVRQIQTPIGQR